jgi:superfamily II helicase
MGAKRTVQYRNPDTGEIAARENRSEGICMSCAKEIMRRQLDFSGRDESFSIK